MDSISITTTIISLIIAVLSVTFGILGFARNKSNDSKEIETRLTKIETDILYIRHNIDEDKEWRKDVDKKLQNHEVKLISLERRH